MLLPPHRLLGAVILALLGCVPAHPALAQPSSREIGEDFLAHPESYVEVQDGFFIRSTTSSGRPLQPGELISAAYQFEMIYDTTSRVQYTLSECMHNGRRLRLLAWRDSHVHSAGAEMMSDSSRTETFAVAPGDTVSIYREWKWYDPRDFRQDTVNFISLDTLDYTVELVSASTASRIAVLDSFGVLPRTTPGPPVFHGSRPIMATARYVVPAAAPADSAFIRIRLYIRGDGLYLPIRRDEITVGSSFALEHGYWNGYLGLYGGVLGKRPAAELSGARASERARLEISRLTAGTIAIGFSAPEGMGPLRIAIYDVNGNLLFIPYSSLGAVEGGTATYVFQRSGAYFVALQRGGALLAVENITITQ
jgi:hypothetical protein